MSRRASTRERRYYDPGSNPQPVRSYAPNKLPTKRKESALDWTILDATRAERAEAKRAAKRARRREQR